MIYLFRYTPFQNSLRDIYLVFDSWDRTTGNIASPESEKGETDIEIPVAPSVSVAKKSDKKHKNAAEKEKEKLKEVRVIPLNNFSVRQMFYF